jgi:hypothetical protein
MAFGHWVTRHMSLQGQFREGVLAHKTLAARYEIDSKQL